MDYMNAIQQRVFKYHGVILTDSLSIAKVFKKKHRNVMRAIDNFRKEIRGLLKVEHTPENVDMIRSIGFWDGSYTNTQNNQKYRDIFMNKRAFLNIVMQFNGKQAIKFKNMYFTAFDRLEQNQKTMRVNKLSERKKSTVLLQSYQTQHALEIQKHNNSLLKRENDKLSNRASYIEHVAKKSELIPIGIIAQSYGTTAQQLNNFLNFAGIIYRRGSSWHLYAPYLKNGLAAYHIKLLMWTAKGKYFIYTLLKSRYKITPDLESGKNFNEYRKLSDL